MQACLLLEMSNRKTQRSLCCLPKAIKGLARWILLTAIGCILIGTAGTCLAQPSDNADGLEYLKNLSIEQLLQTEVTSVSKKAEHLFDTAAAVFVITQEDIKRTGARTIPEALRIVPGLQVAHINGSTWAITSRGFNEWFSNKLLVLIDGRSVYTPLFSGVYWNVQDTVLEDIERIEVIRGPGATMWGANAVNGVINIITKHAEDTQGGLLVAGFGTAEKPLTVARYGDRLGDDISYRVYAKGVSRNSFRTPDGDDANDEWESLRAGFRTDWALSYQDEFTLQGEAYSGSDDLDLELSGYVTPPFTRKSEEQQDYFGGHLLSNWERTLSDDADIQVKAYYDWAYRDQVVIEERRHTLNVEFQHRFKPHQRHELVWGLGYRWTTDDTKGSTNLWMEPGRRDDSLWNAFIQDDIMLWPDKLWLTLGSKFEHNDYTGFEIQPSARLRWKPTPQHMVWGAVSRAVRAPSRSDHDIRLNLASANIPPFGVNVLRVTGDDSFDSEELIAYEMGLRWQPEERLSFDLTAFYNDYDKLRIVEDGVPFIETTPPPPHVVVPQIISNGMEGETFGVEALTSWQPFERWKLNFGYAWFDYNLDADGDGAENEGGISPQHQFQIRSYLDLPWSLSLDTEVYYVDDLKSLDVPSYTRFDVRLGWEPTSTVAFSLNIENLFDDRHQEFPTRSGIVYSEVPRIIYSQITIRF